jgi:hypothetical protein
LSQKAVVGDPDPAVKKGDGGYADWVIVALQCLREYLDHPYRRLPDVLSVMPRIVSKLGLTVDELPDFHHRVYAQARPRNADLADAAAVVCGVPRPW